MRKPCCQTEVDEVLLQLRTNIDRLYIESRPLGSEDGPEQRGYATACEDFLKELEKLSKELKMDTHQHHQDQSIEQVLRTVRDMGWGVYGPGFPFQIFPRYEGLLVREEIQDAEALHGTSFKITLTEQGQRYLNE